MKGSKRVALAIVVAGSMAITEAGLYCHYEAQGLFDPMPVANCYALIEQGKPRLPRSDRKGPTKIPVNVVGSTTSVSTPYS